MGGRQFIKGIGRTVLKLPEIRFQLLPKSQACKLSFSAALQSNFYLVNLRNVFFSGVFIVSMSFLMKIAHLYWASVILGLKGKPFTERPVRILKEKVNVDNSLILRFANFTWWRQHTSPQDRGLPCERFPQSRKVGVCPPDQSRHGKPQL